MIASAPMSAPVAPGAALIAALQRVDRDFSVCPGPEGARVVEGRDPAAIAWVPALTPDRLGGAGFAALTGARVNYAGGAMANGIASEAVVIALGRAGALGFFGAAGLSIPRITAAIDAIQAALGPLPYGFNLIHSPQEPAHEQATVEIYLARGVRLVEAAAFLRLTPAVVQYRAAGLSEGPAGEVLVANKIIAKVSREEVATHFLQPAPAKLLRGLVEAGRISELQARLAARVPMADALTAEADSGGHTDNRPLPVLLPLLMALRDRLALPSAPRVLVGAAGGISTPQAAAAAFAMGADYILTGTVNQACVESGTSEMARALLAEAAATDVGMAPASDMFEAGVQVQVLQRGTLFAPRGQRLYDTWRAHAAWAEVPAVERERIERTILARPFEEVWGECERFFAERDPSQLERASKDEKHRMALVFRWYLGLSSRWAIGGVEARKADAQIWCGPGIGAFNAWTRGTFLESAAERRVAVVMANFMTGAAAITRAGWLRAQGVDPGPAAFQFSPRPIVEAPA